jgi:predicted nucleic acid-binding protein
MKPSAYLETSVVSYFAARPSRDLVVAAHQEITRRWWETRMGDFRIVISDFVVREASAGDPAAAKERLDLLKPFSLLDVTSGVEGLASDFLRRRIVPRRKIIDAFHIALCSVHSVEYLITWNCAHIANAEIRSSIAFACDQAGYSCPTICTPEELMGAT